jgi:hypothetical protein
LILFKTYFRRYQQKIIYNKPNQTVYGYQAKKPKNQGKTGKNQRGEGQK